MLRFSRALQARSGAFQLRQVAVKFSADASSNGGDGESSGDGAPIARGAEARGSMRQYLQDISKRKEEGAAGAAAAPKGGLFANMSKKMGPAPTQQSGQRATQRNNNSNNSSNNYNRNNNSGAQQQQQQQQQQPYRPRNNNNSYNNNSNNGYNRSPQQRGPDGGQGQRPPYTPRQGTNSNWTPRNNNSNNTNNNNLRNNNSSNYRGSNNNNNNFRNNANNNDANDDEEEGGKRRFMNKRAFRSKNPFQSGGVGGVAGKKDEGSAAAMFGADVAGSSFQRSKRGKRGGETEEQMQQSMQQEDYDGENEEVPPGIGALLFDNEHYVDMQKQGKLGDFMGSNSMDAIDNLMAEAFIQSYKTTDNSYSNVLESPQFNRTRIPQPRSIASLLHSINNPPIKSVAPDTAGYALGEQAWSVINKNYYFNDEEKYRLTNEIAALAERYEQYTSMQEGSGKEGGQPLEHDAIFTSTFRAGLPGIEEEMRLKALEDDKPRDANEFVQAETDWDVEAVEDEDSL